ncbi:MAG: TonB-dependent receptor [Pseudoxanthomonas sp.]
MKKLTSVMAVCAAVFAMPCAFAQQAVPAEESPAQPDGKSEGKSATDLDAVVVTSQRREQVLKDVPIAISAVTAELLDKAGITNVQDLGNVTPGLSFAVEGAFAQPTIRGIGTSVTGAGADANVAIYVDGVYQPSQTANLFNFNNIERVEVLKGPQGTLFGRNATGGAIRIITSDPDEYFKGNFGLGYGSFDEVTAGGYLNIPISENVAANVAANYTRNDGYVKNVTTGNEIGNMDDIAVRAKLKIQASDKLSFVLAGSYSDTENNAPFAVRPIDGNNASRQLGAVFPPGYYEAAMSFDPTIKTRVSGASLTAMLDLDAGTVSSITSYQDMENTLHSDIDNGPLYLNHVLIPSWQKNFAQEVNFASNFGGAFDLVAGVYYYKDDSSLDIEVFTGNPEVQVAAVEAQVKTKAISAYAEGSFRFTDSVEGILGARFSDEEKKSVGGIPGLTLVDTSKSWSSFTPRAVLRKKLASGSNVYASYSKGFKSGNYNSVSLSPVPVDPETVDAYEVGFKAGSRKYSFSSSAYYYDYQDIQVQIQTNVNGVLATVLQNAANAEIYGVDAELAVSVTDSFKINAGAAWTHARYADYEGAIITSPIIVDGVAVGGNTQTPGDASGNRMIRTPEFTANLTGTYTKPLLGGELELSATGSYNDGFYRDPGNLLKEDPYFLVSGRVAWTSPNGAYRVSVWGRNLLDEEYLFYVNNTSSGNSGAPAMPASYGIKFETFF